MKKSKDTNGGAGRELAGGRRYTAARRRMISMLDDERGRFSNQQGLTKISLRKKKQRGKREGDRP